MGIQRRLPEGENIRLQEAVTWAFTGWAYFDATDAELREREDLPDSIYGLLPPLYDRGERMERDEYLFRNFDFSLSDACFRGLVEMVGRKNSYSEYEQIPTGYFFRPRGFTDFAGSRISETPACSTFDEIASSGPRGGWVDVIVHRAQFISWFSENKSSLFTGGKSTFWPQQNACRDGVDSCSNSTVSNEKQAINKLAEALLKSPNLTKEAAADLVGFTPKSRAFDLRIWPKARLKAGLPRMAPSGRKPKSPH